VLRPCRPPPSPSPPLRLMWPPPLLQTLAIIPMSPNPTPLLDFWDEDEFKGIHVSELQNPSRPPPRQIPLTRTRPRKRRPCQGSRPSSSARSQLRSSASASLR
jgi:hypothetical protein